MTLNPKLQAAATSYARALIAAALPVWVATNDWKATSHALWAAAIPPIMRWANPSDPMGRNTKDTPT
jgi:hypothetical protein